MVKTICILTKSVKDRGYCVAGIDVETGEWIRLVSTKSGEAIEKETLDDEKNPIEVLDVVAVNLKEYVPHKCQTENWLLDEKSLIIKRGHWGLTNVLRIKSPDKPDLLFGNDKAELTRQEARNLRYSLLIIAANDVVFDTSMKGDGRHHHKVSFKYNGTEYKRNSE
jgi:hypothetical protein